MCGATDHSPRVSGSVVPYVPHGPLLGLLGVACSLPPGNVLVLFGEAGAGKSGLASTAFERPHVTSSEMEPALVLAYAARHTTKIGGVSMVRVSDQGGIDLDVARTPRGWPDLILDSGNNTGDPLGSIKACKAYAVRHNARAIVIMHVRKDGRLRGSAVLEHEPDVLIELTRTRLEVKKSRFGPECRFQIRRDSSGRHTLAKLRKYYSVEGTDGGRLWLSAVPTKGARRADVFKKKHRDALEGGELPPPPCAAAAVRSDLYSAGWSEPEDLADRIAYAHAHGIPYYSPVSGLLEASTDVSTDPS